MRPDDVMDSFRRLFAARPETAQGLAEARDLDSAAELLDRIGARHGIATSAAEIRGHVRRLRDELSRGELSPDQLDHIAAGVAAPGGSDLALMLSMLGQDSAVP
ncbi:hypothetical protein [Teichococcus cervicalis]|uniref:Uncharacterized protein n=1 Tax=Pseudoroseomonas cervicalis ATCC 49957 TaxID=525371 RepID=D5RH00_9PROT|nr:hypothetical protein [Pseudoroseomonas cervicalis]EFH13419.1 hypothetical protein HMPREF0731_0359 [Pseudoroseomonas cervicalis ATCC 49957]